MGLFGKKKDNGRNDRERDGGGDGGDRSDSMNAMPNFIEVSLAERTKRFWDWFSKNEKTLSDMSGREYQGDSDSIISLINEGTSLISDDVHYNIGGDHEFTFAVSGNDALFFMLPYVTQNMPERFKEKWHFFPCMQGTGGQGFGFQMHGINVDSDNVMVSVFLIEESNTVNLRFFAEEWAGLADNECYGAFYILMENIIGEALANACLNEVNRAEMNEDGMFPLTNLESWMYENLCEEGRAPNPADRYFTYQLEPRLGDDNKSTPLRDDIFIGTGNYMPLLGAYADGSDEIYNIFTGFGAKPVFLYYSFDEKADRNELLNDRYEISDLLEAEVLGERGSGNETGLLLGGAMGVYNVYIDLLLYDEKDFFTKARNVLACSKYKIFCKEFLRDGAEYPLNP